MIEAANLTFGQSSSSRCNNLDGNPHSSNERLAVFRSGSSTLLSFIPAIWIFGPWSLAPTDGQQAFEAAEGNMRTRPMLHGEAFGA